MRAVSRGSSEASPNSCEPWRTSTSARWTRDGGGVGTRGARPHVTKGGVTRIVVMSDTLPLAEIKAHLSEIIDRVEHQHDRIVLTRNGRPAAVIMSPGDLEALEDTLELLSDPEALAEIKAARADASAGRIISADELRAKYLRK
jgi:antitoxin YefM